MTPAATEGPRCLIVDDHPVVRAGIRVLLEEAFAGSSISDVGSLEDTAGASNRQSPDVVIIDPWQAGVDVGEVVGRVQSDHGAPTVIFTSHSGARLLSQALKAGVKGYVRKDSPAENLIRAVEAASSGELYVDPESSSKIAPEGGDRPLSARQREVLLMLADGMQTDAVAGQLGLSTETVRTHTKRILAKLDASTRTQAVAIGIRYGLIE